MKEKILKATHNGELNIGDMVIPCAVLEDGTRVLTHQGLLKTIGRANRGIGGLDMLEKSPSFFFAKNLMPFVSEELAGWITPVNFHSITGKKSYGYKAEILPKICDVYLQARDADALNKPQFKFATICELIVRGLAQVGIVALVDEATGYQEIRDRRALQAILDKYLEKELAAWAKRFPDEFYQQMFRLRGWRWNGMSVSRPGVVGKYTKDLIYERLAPGIVKELEKRNPIVKAGRRKAKHHQWLTEDVGHQALAQHLYGIIGMMRASRTWDQFYRMVQQAYPKKGDSLTFDFEN